MRLTVTATLHSALVMERPKEKKKEGCQFRFSISHCIYLYNFEAPYLVLSHLIRHTSSGDEIPGSIGQVTKHRKHQQKND